MKLAQEMLVSLKEKIKDKDAAEREKIIANAFPTLLRLEETVDKAISKLAVMQTVDVTLLEDYLGEGAELNVGFICSEREKKGLELPSLEERKAIIKTCCANMLESEHVAEAFRLEAENAFDAWVENR